MIPAFNEEKNLEKAVSEISRVLKEQFTEYEILIFNDNSEDKTKEIADNLSSKDKKIKVIHNETNMGLGFNYMKGAEIASMDYFTWFPGDNENSADSFISLFEKIQEADIIIPYPTNNEIRAWHRRFISSSYVKFLNTIFGLNLKYYNGTIIYKTKLLKSVKITTHGFAYSSEILVRLLSKGNKYVEVGIKLNPSHKTSIFRIKNMLSVLKTFLILFYDIKIMGRK
jgi:glycosyltransferase involved in cell wall biosynthesis